MPQSSAAIRAQKALRAQSKAAKRLDSATPIEEPVIVREDHWARVTPAPRPLPVRRDVRWATKPLQTAAGRCLAVEQANGHLRVLVDHKGQRRWCDLDHVMGEESARLWAKTGFGR